MEAAEWPVRHLFGFPVHALSMEQVLEIVDETIRSRGRLLIGVVNAAKLVNMRRDAVLRDAVLDAHMVLADGMAVVWACRLVGQPVPERVPGIDLMERMLERGSSRHYRVFCLGARQEVLSTAVQRMQELYPGLVVAGSRHGYFGSDEEPAIAEQIRESRADILFAAMSPPKKEQFLAKWSQHIGVPVCHGVGGAFDVMAGKVQRAPQAWQRLGLEWLYRVVQEPRRMWRRYLVTNTLFCGMLVGEMLRPARPHDCPANQSRASGG